METTYYCPLCEHCERRKEQELQLLKCKLEREEVEAQKELERAIENAAKESMRLKEQGVIYGNNYDAYSVEDIKNITNYTFLERLSHNIITPGQPQDDVSSDAMFSRHEAVLQQLNEVLINEME